MSSLCPRRGARNGAGFTLIELLVVVAIIALLISILLPSLSKARAQARTSLCLSRIAQFGKAFMMYSEDYGGKYPFISEVPDNDDDGGMEKTENWPVEWGELGQALGVDSQQAAVQFQYMREGEWDADTRRLVLRSGTLFPYTRFEALYRCPEFERVKTSDKHQDTFNYSRPMWGRKWRLTSDPDSDDDTEQWGDCRGPIVSSSSIHMPSELPLILDEQYDRFIATAGELGDNNSSYNASEWVFGPDNNQGAYHGTPTTSRFGRPGGTSYDVDQYGMTETWVWEQGGVCWYDGHASLERDPWPARTKWNWQRQGPFRLQLSYPPSRFLDEQGALSQWIAHLLYAQRGYDPPNGQPPAPWGS